MLGVAETPESVARLLYPLFTLFTWLEDCFGARLSLKGHPGLLKNGREQDLRGSPRCAPSLGRFRQPLFVIRDKGLLKSIQRVRVASLALALARRIRIAELAAAFIVVQGNLSNDCVTDFIVTCRQPLGLTCVGLTS